MMDNAIPLDDSEEVGFEEQAAISPEEWDESWDKNTVRDEEYAGEAKEMTPEEEQEYLDSIAENPAFNGSVEYDEER